MTYNDKIIIQQSATTQDAYGEMDRAWTTYKTLWAEVDNQGSSIGYEGGQPVSRSVKSFRFRTADAPAVETYPHMRISYDSDYYAITGIDEEGRLFTVVTAETFDDE